MAERAAERMDADTFLGWAEGREGRFELVDGVVIAMAGAQQAHDTVVVNVLASLRVQLRGSGCRPFSGDTGVKTTAGTVRRPDAGVDCGDRHPGLLHATDPRLLMEVLSPSNRPIAVIRKLEEYRALPSVSAVLVVDPGIVQVQLWSRDGAAWASRVFEDLAQSIALPDLGIDLPLAVIYEDVPLPPRLVT